MKGFGDQSKSKKKKASYFSSKYNHDQILLQALKYHSEGNTSKAERCYRYLIEDGFKDERVFNNYI